VVDVVDVVVVLVDVVVVLVDVVVVEPPKEDPAGAPMAGAGATGGGGATGPGGGWTGTVELRGELVLL
jgi:hypothetical protein